MTGKIGAPLSRATNALKTVENREEEREPVKEKERKNVLGRGKRREGERGEARNCRFHSDLYLESSARSIQGVS